jgi:hypothetical protein
MELLLLIGGLVVAVWAWYAYETRGVKPVAINGVMPLVVTRSYTSPTGPGGDTSLQVGVAKMAEAGYTVAAMVNAPSAMGGKWTRTIVTFKRTEATP